MNPEQERVAAAMNLLRPDWPVKQLRTLLADDRICHRPLRDTIIALAWVASEPRSASPYRVLEHGPWWRAVLAEESVHFQALDRADRCQICGRSEQQCRANPFAEHEFRVDVRQPSGLDVPRIVETLKGDVQPLSVETPEPRPVKHTAHGDAARDLLTTHPRPVAPAPQEVAR